MTIASSTPTITEHLRMLSETIGPRGSATPKEEEAARYVLDQFKSYGLESYSQHFQAPTSFSWVYMALFAMAPLAAAVFPFRPGLGFALAALGALGYLAEVSTFSILGRLVPKRRSVNVLAKAHARSKELRRVVITAHLDSSRSALNFSPKLVPGFRRSFWTTFGASAGVAVLYGIAIFVPEAPNLAIWYLSLICAAAVAVALALLVHRELAGRITPGANDNASGVAAMLEIARVLGRAPLLTTEVWFAATGAEEAGLWGALHLIKECRFDQARTQIINLDNLGAGRLTVTTGEGMIIPVRGGAELLDAARSAAAEKGIDLAQRPYRLMTTDATAFMARRYQAVSVMAFDRRGLMPNWHWITDTMDRVEEANVAAARDLVLGMIRQLGD